MDIFFRYRHGIRNRSHCAEGVTAADSYRIVQTRPKAEPWQPREYFDEPIPKGFELLREFDLYQVWGRSSG